MTGKPGPNAGLPGTPPALVPASQTTGPAGLPDPPPNPTQCDQVWHDGAWRVWCEAVLAGPCVGCPDAAR